MIFCRGKLRTRHANEDSQSQDDDATRSVVMNPLGDKVPIDNRTQIVFSSDVDSWREDSDEKEKIVMSQLTGKNFMNLDHLF